MERPLDSAATLRRFALPALVCSAILAAAYLRTAQGAAHPSPWGYRLWSFGALAYSDIFALHEDRAARRHGLPYLEDRVEYPVLLGVYLWWPSLVAPGRAGYFALTFFVLALCALGTLWVIASFPRALPWAWGASPALLVYAGLNWDLLAILPLAAGLWLWARERPRAAVAVLSLAVWTKFFPLLAVGLLLVCATRQSWKLAAELGAIFACVSLLLNAPFALFARDNWSWFFVFNGARELEASVYLLGGADPRGFIHAANVISASVTVATAAVLCAVELRTRRLDVLRALCGLICVFFVANKVFSPQYWLWIVACMALAGLPAWLCSAASVTALADFAITFARLHLQGERDWAQALWFDGAVFHPLIAVRALVLAACAAWAFSHLLDRKGSQPAQLG